VTGEAARDQERAKLHDAELAEFAEAAPGRLEPEPTFREGLREKLWKMVRRQLGREVDDPKRLG
jgi:hypothetical protein